MATEKPRRSKRITKKEQAVSYEIPSPRMQELLSALDKRGLLEAVTGALNDEATFSQLMAVFSSDQTLSLIQNVKPITKLLSTIDYNALSELAQVLSTEKQALGGAVSIIRLISALEKRGLIEPIAGLLNDEKAFANIAKLLSNDATLELVNNLQNLTKLSSMLDSQVLATINKAAGSLKTEAKPVKGVIAVTRQLGDSQVAAGMGKLFEILRVLGEDSSK